MRLEAITSPRFAPCGRRERSGTPVGSSSGAAQKPPSILSSPRSQHSAPSRKCGRRVRMIAQKRNAAGASRLHTVAVAVVLFFQAQGSRRATGKRCRSVLYVHYPKTGGSSIATILLKQLPDLCLPPPSEFFHWYHMPAAAQKQYYGDTVFNEAYKIATVRNPYALAVSTMFMLDVCFLSNLPEDFIPTSFCPFILASWPTTQNSTLYHLTLRRVFTEFVSRFYTGSLDCHDAFSGSMLPPHKNCTQHAWITDDSGEDVIVDEVHRLEDGGDFMSAQGIRRRACACNASPSPVTTVHVQPERAAAGDILELQTKQGAHFTYNFSPHLLELYINMKPHKDPFFYYTAATCEAIVRAYAKDFVVFRYDPSECLARIGND